MKLYEYLIKYRRHSERTDTTEESTKIVIALNAEDAWITLRKGMKEGNGKITLIDIKRIN